MPYNMATVKKKFQVCSQCGERKEINEKNFYWRSERQEWRLDCKLCHNKRRYKTVPKWRRDNPEKVREFNKLKERRLRENPVYRLKKNIGSVVYYSLKQKNLSKHGEATFNYLPYSLEELTKHLESLFEHWMHWGNYGAYRASSWDDNDFSTWTWQLDHIIPHSELLYDSMKHPNFQKCWALENLRPLSAKQNILDGVHRVRHKKNK